MENWHQRTDLILGETGVNALAGSRVLVVGAGGVGAYAIEMLARAGVGAIDIIDGDCVGITNVNRQLPALHSTVGIPKVELMKSRMLDINPEVKVDARCEFITADGIENLFARRSYDFVVDAIDSISPKVALIEYCLANGIRIISSMGAGGRLDPSRVKYADIWSTANDGLAKAVRTRMKKHGIRRKLPVVWSEEPPRKSSVVMTDEIDFKRSSYGTVSYLPAIFGCMLGAYVIRKLTGE